MATDHGPAEERLVGESIGIGPEMMMRGGAEFAKALSHFSRRSSDGGVDGVAENPDASVNGDRTRRPSVLFVQSEPAVSSVVMNVHRIEEGNKNIHI